MKRFGLIFSTVVLFALSLYLAYEQGASSGSLQGFIGGHLAAPSGLAGSLNAFEAQLLNVFGGLVSSLTAFFGGSLIAAVIVLALLVELALLYPAVSIQLKQKKIHLFHKKLVNRFLSGELSLSDSNRELDVLYSVNENIHRRGALLISAQLIVFVAVLMGLNLLSQNPAMLSGGSFDSFNFALFAKPVSAALPALAGLAYFLHSLIKIHLKQREDYISPMQTMLATFFGLFASAVVFFFAEMFATLLSVYFLTQITFATMRYIIVEENAKVWGKQAQKELIKLLHSAKLHKNKIEHLSRRFNHHPMVRSINFHLLEEALSMSLALVITLNGLLLI